MEMRTGNLWKQILVFSLPLMCTNLLEMLFNMADVAIVGKFATPLSLGAVGSTSILVFLMTCLPLGLGAGINAVTALFIGASQAKREHNCIHTAFLLSLMGGFLMCFIGIMLSSPVLTLMGTKPELIDEALLYFRIYMCGAPALALFNYGNAILSAVGDTKKPLKYLTVSGIINVLLNLLFVIVFHMAAAGVGLATIIAQYISAGLVLVSLIRRRDDHRLCLKQIHFDRKMAGKILSIGIPSALQNALFAFANLFLQASVNTFSHVVVEGNSAAANADNIVYILMAAFYTAGTSFIAQNLGAGNKKRIGKTYLITTLYALIVGIAAGWTLVIFRTGFLGLFTNDPAVIAAGELRVIMICLAAPLSVFMDNANAAARGLNKAAIPTFITFLGTVVFRIIWLYTAFVHFRTLASIYVLFPISWIMTSVLENIYFFIQYRKIQDHTSINA